VLSFVEVRFGCDCMLGMRGGGFILSFAVFSLLFERAAGQPVSVCVVASPPQSLLNPQCERAGRRAHAYASGRPPLQTDAYLSGRVLSLAHVHRERSSQQNEDIRLFTCEQFHKLLDGTLIAVQTTAEQLASPQNTRRRPHLVSRNDKPTE